MKQTLIILSLLVCLVSSQGLLGSLTETLGGVVESVGEVVESVGSIVGAVMDVLAPVSGNSASATSTYVPATGKDTSTSSFINDCLEPQNALREEVIAPALTWAPDLAVSAQAYAEELAATDDYKHSGKAGVGENMNRGTKGAYTVQQLISAWAAEKKYYVAGTFPNVSSTGNWEDVGHYTQVIWKATKEVGCGEASSAKWTYLVCQYKPPGNVQGFSADSGLAVAAPQLVRRSRCIRRRR